MCIRDRPAEGSTETLDDDPSRVRIAFVGRPNVGKSTLVNRILGEERMIASEVPGTTRDSIAVDLERDGRKYRLIDTAGLRRRGKVEEAVEKFSAFKTLQAVSYTHLDVYKRQAKVNNEVLVAPAIGGGMVFVHSNDCLLYTSRYLSRLQAIPPGSPLVPRAQ